MALPSMGDQFKGLPMGDLIGGPLMAACDAQVRLANSTADFIKVIGFLPPAAGSGRDLGDVRVARFQFDRPAAVTSGTPAGAIPVETVRLDVPLLALVKIPSLSVNLVDITFDMEVKNSEHEASSSDSKAELDAEASVNWGVFSLKVKVHGSVSSHKENTRSSDQSAKYHVRVLAEDKGMPEGLARVLDIIQTSIAPKAISQGPAPITIAKDVSFTANTSGNKDAKINFGTVLTADQTALFTPGRRFSIAGSASNNGVFTVSATQAAAPASITVNETTIVTDATPSTAPIVITFI